MAMHNFDREEFGAPMAEINTTPLVDVMLVLLVIFLVTAPMMTQGVKLELPNETASDVADENPLTISVTAEGAYYFGEEAVTEMALETRLSAIAAISSDRPIHLRADTAAPYGKVGKLLAAAQQSGLNNIGFLTESR